MNDQPAPLGPYERGETTYFASQYDQRFGYYLYVPTHFSFETAKDFVLCIPIHGSGRGAQTYREELKEFGQKNNAIVLAPLFPAGIVRPGEVSNYKFIEFEGIRYDLLLLGMIEEISKRYLVPADNLLLFGFSGGAHFVHRFFYLHPERLRAVAIGSPGAVTLIDDETPWWCGTKDLEARFGRAIDAEALRKVAVQMIVGGSDTETWEITFKPESPNWMEGANDAGVTRIDRLRTLQKNYEANGIEVDFRILDGVGHDGRAILKPAIEFFTRIRQQHRGESASHG